LFVLLKIIIFKNKNYFVLARVTIQNVELIEVAYKSISFDDLQKIFGLNTKMVQQICNDRGWQIDSGGIYILPKRNGFIFNFKIFLLFYLHLFR
jgi:hypothetical protein